MKSHFINSSTLVTERKAQAVCKKPDCEVLGQIPTDLDIRQSGVRGIVTCKECDGAELKESYVYFARG